MPVDLVNASSAALGGDGMCRATLIVTPLVADEALPPPLPEHDVASSARHDSAPTTAAGLACRMESMAMPFFQKTTRHCGCAEPRVGRGLSASRAGAPGRRGQFE